MQRLTIALSVALLAAVAVPSAVCQFPVQIDAGEIDTKVRQAVDGNEDVDQRIKRLESKVEAMREEIAALRKSLSVEASQPGPENARGLKDQKLASAASSDPGSNRTASMPKKDATQDLSFSAGDFRVTPYGIIFFNAFSNSGGTNNADDPLWASPGGTANASASARQTRFGLRFEGGKLGNAKVNGVVEADFYGGFPGVGVGENMGVVRLRLAHVRLNWEKTSVVIGQDWMIFAPNSPTSLAAQAIPQFAAAGNPWSRLPQVRVDQKLGTKFLWQGAILAPQTGDFPAGGSTPALLQPGSGASSRVPFFQSRLAFSEANWFGTQNPGTIGIAGHYGRSLVTNGVTTDSLNSYGLALDWKFPVFKRVTVAGEAFFGENLGGFQAGIFQGYNTDFASPQNANPGASGGIRPIGTSGGWIQLGWNLPAFKDRLSMYGSFGIDDPQNSDLTTVGNRNFRSRNRGFAYDLIYVFNPQFSLGGELRRLETSYILGNRESSNHLNFGAKYSF